MWQEPNTLFLIIMVKRNSPYIEECKTIHTLKNGTPPPKKKNLFNQPKRLLKVLCNSPQITFTLRFWNENDKLQRMW